MYPHSRFRHESNVEVSLLWILGILAVSLPRHIALAHAQGGDEPERAISNHETQVRVSGPSNVRINTWNGNLFYSFPLLTIPGRGLGHHPGPRAWPLSALPRRHLHRHR